MQNKEQGKKEQTHQRIIETAAKAIRRDGYDGVSVANLMKEAGLTHGGFYSHFLSREAMLVEAMEKAAFNGKESLQRNIRQRVLQDNNTTSVFKAFVEVYLSEEHLMMVEQGCPIAALGSEITRQHAPLREMSCQYIDSLQSTIANMLSGPEAGNHAVVILSSLVGTMQLARAYGNTDQSRKLLSTVRESLVEQYDR